MSKFWFLLMLFVMIQTAKSQTSESDTVWVKEIGTQVKAVKFSPDGQFIYAAAIGRKPMKLSTETGEILREYEGFFYEATEHFSALDISSDGKWLIGGEYGNNMFIIDTETGSIVKTLTTEYQEIQSNKFNTVTITPDKRYVIATNRFSFDAVTPMNGIVIWDATSGELIKVINSINAMKVKASPDNSHFAVSYYDESQSEIQIYDVGTWETSASLCCHSSLIQDIAFSLDGSLLASGGWGGEIKVWNTLIGQDPIILPDYNDITAIGFLGDNKIVCNGSINFLDSYTKIWDINEKRVLAMIPTSRPYCLDIHQNTKDVVLANYKSLLLFNADKLITNIYQDETVLDDFIITPNPSMSSFKISFHLSQSGKTQVEILDLNSNQISLLHAGFMEAGNHNLNWLTKGIPSGTYFCRINGKNFSKTLKIMLEK